MKFRIGDYVQVIKTPDPWEGSGEVDPEHHIGHIGIVVEVERGSEFDDFEGMAYVRFPYTGAKWTEPKGICCCERNIEFEALLLISRPEHSMCQTTVEG